MFPTFAKLPRVAQPAMNPTAMLAKNSTPAYSAASLEAAPARTLTPTGSASSSMRNPGE